MSLQNIANQSGESLRRYLTPEEASRYLAIPLRSLERLRLTGNGPAFCKVNRLCRYDVTELDRFMKSRQRTSTSDPGDSSSDQRPAA
jgi:hypothetical protein